MFSKAHDRQQYYNILLGMHVCICIGRYYVENIRKVRGPPRISQMGRINVFLAEQKYKKHLKAFKKNTSRHQQTYICVRFLKLRGVAYAWCRRPPCIRRILAGFLPVTYGRETLQDYTRQQAGAIFRRRSRSRCWQWCRRWCVATLYRESQQ